MSIHWEITDNQLLEITGGHRAPVTPDWCTVADVPKRVKRADKNAVIQFFAYRDFLHDQVRIQHGDNVISKICLLAGCSPPLWDEMDLVADRLCHIGSEPGAPKWLQDVSGHSEYLRSVEEVEY